MGNDLLYWSNAAKFALEILIGQHYVPALRMNGGSTLYALWQPALLDDRMKRRFAALVETMPTVCRAYAIDKPEDALAPADLTEHFVATVVDAAVRAWGSGHGVNGRHAVNGRNGTNGHGTELPPDWSIRPLPCSGCASCARQPLVDAAAPACPQVGAGLAELDRTAARHKRRKFPHCV